MQRRNLLLGDTPAVATGILGLSLIVAVLVTTWFTADFHLTLMFGHPFMTFLVCMFVLVRPAKHIHMLGGRLDAECPQSDRPAR